MGHKGNQPLGTKTTDRGFGYLDSGWRNSTRDRSSACVKKLRGISDPSPKTPSVIHNRKESSWLIYRFAFPARTDRINNDSIKTERLISKHEQLNWCISVDARTIFIRKTFFPGNCIKSQTNDLHPLQKRNRCFLDIVCSKSTDR